MPTYLTWSLLNWSILLLIIVAAVWVWLDARNRHNPWAPTWALATLLLFPLALGAYLLARRAGPVSGERRTLLVLRGALIGASLFGGVALMAYVYALVTLPQSGCSPAPCTRPNPVGPYLFPVTLLGGVAGAWVAYVREQRKSVT